MTEYFAALGQRNLEALSRTLHFPFAIYEEIEPVVVHSAADLLATPPATLNTTGRGATHDKAHTMNGYLRYTTDGNLISETRGVGIRICKAGTGRARAVSDR